MMKIKIYNNSMVNKNLIIWVKLENMMSFQMIINRIKIMIKRIYNNNNNTSQMIKIVWFYLKFYKNIRIKVKIVQNKINMYLWIKVHKFFKI
jgi:hypothetical protein